MLTQCPDCRRTYPISKKHAQMKKAQVYCPKCKKKFTASVLLDEKSPEPATEAVVAEKPSELVAEAKTEYIPKQETRKKPKPAKKSAPTPPLMDIGRFLKKTDPVPDTVTPTEYETTPERLPWEDDNKPLNINWLTGCVIGLALLIAQFIYFEHGNWSQNVAYRPALEKLCSWLGCQVADYENLAEFAVLQGSFTPNSNNTFVFKAAITNQAPFNQKLPNIKLNLLDFNEQLLGQRIFSPNDYLSETRSANLSIAPDETVEAKLTIAAPSTPVGGYNFDLIY